MRRTGRVTGGKVELVSTRWQRNRSPMLMSSPDPRREGRRDRAAIGGEIDRAAAAW
jgi:hypothetical protein